MTSYSYDRITSALSENIGQVTQSMRSNIKDGEREKAQNLAYSLWGAFRLWERITCGDRPDGVALKFEESIEKLLQEAAQEIGSER